MTRLAPLDVLRAPDLAAQAASERPVWLFDAAGQTLLFANPTGAAVFGFASCAAAAGASFEHTEIAAQISRSATTLRPDGRARLERLRGIGAPFGRPLTCACSRITTSAGSAILIAAVEPCGPSLTLAERAQRLIEGSGAAVAAFAADDTLLHATPDAAPRLDGVASLSEINADADMLRVGEGANAITFVIFSAETAHASRADAASSDQAAADDAPVDLSPIADAMAAIDRREPAIAQTRQRPLRFVWETDAENRFTIASEDFVALAGPRTAGLLGRFWGEISAKLALDPEGLVAQAMVSRDTWSGIAVNWPIASGERIAVELSGIPAFDRERVFCGYRGWGVCHDRMVESFTDSEATVPADAAQSSPLALESTAQSAAGAVEPSEQTIVSETEHAPADTASPPENVVPFRAASAAAHDPRHASVGPMERSPFAASRLAARLKGADELARGLIGASESLPDYVAPVPATLHLQAQTARDLRPAEDSLAVQRPALDQLPHGVLIYRLNTFIYANQVFLDLTGHASLGDFAQEGGLDSLFIEADSHTSATANAGQSLRISAPGKLPMEGRLNTVTLDGETAMALTLFPPAAKADEPATAPEEPAASADLKALLDLAADGIVMLDREGCIVEANAGAARLFGTERSDLAGRPFGDLFAPDSERAAKAKLDRLIADRETGPIDDDREIIGRRRNGSVLSLQMILGRTEASGARFCAVFRDITRWKDTEKDLIAARQQAEKASSAKSEFLAKISHEMRTPLNAIIGFSEVMMEERFGPVGNERYRDYLKDINTSGAHLVSLLNDLLDLSKIEAGKLELSFERVSLNDITQQAVAIMQAQANRARIIIRSALSMNVPNIVADARSVRQIILNLLSNSIKFTGAGGQVIVSTATTDRGEVMLRVRDTGVGMSEKDIETALQPFRQLATARKGDAGGTGLGLPLTKALAEANRARFSIKSAVNAGTLVEIVFPAPRVPVE